MKPRRTVNRNRNWFCVARAMFEHEHVGIHDRPYTRFEAWLWLISRAAYRPTKIINKGRAQPLGCGQLMGARAYLAERWKWSEQNVRTFLKHLELCDMIRLENRHPKPNQQPDNRCQIISICNYEKYQLPAAPRGRETKARLTSNQPESNKIQKKENAGARVRDEAPRAPRFNPTTHRKFVETLHGDELFYGLGQGWRGFPAAASKNQWALSHDQICQRQLYQRISSARK